LGCNLAGMVPWAGTPTTAWGVTMALALVTFGTVVVSGSMKFGVVGFWLNQVPSMDLPFAIALFIKPALFVIEVVGLLIKHVVLSIRLLANMVAGHMVLISILGLAFSLEGAMSSAWTPTAIAAVGGSALLSCLELFVAFLQAYIFTFLSALFIGAAVHHH
jgi:F-type H+-transporting ATPase subunit a